VLDGISGRESNRRNLLVFNNPGTFEGGKEEKMAKLRGSLKSHKLAVAETICGIAKSLDDKDATIARLTAELDRYGNPKYRHSVFELNNEVTKLTAELAEARNDAIERCAHVVCDIVHRSDYRKLKLPDSQAACLSIAIRSLKPLTSS